MAIVINDSHINLHLPDHGMSNCLVSYWRDNSIVFNVGIDKALFIIMFTCSPLLSIAVYLTVQLPLIFV